MNTAEQTMDDDDLDEGLPPQNDDDDRRSALEAAVEALEDDAPAGGDRDAYDAERGQPRAEDGKFAPKDSVGARAPTDESEQPEKPQADPSAQPPQSWNNAARAEWEKLGPEARQFLHKREADITAAMTRVNNAQQVIEQQGEMVNLGQALAQAAQPYLPLIQAEGSDIVTAANNAWGTIATLASGKPSDVAQTLAGAIHQYGVGRFGPQFIAALDQAISQGPRRVPPVQQPAMTPQQIQQTINEQMAQWVQGSYQEKTQTAALSEINDFRSAHEDFDELKPQVMAVLQAHVDNGMEISLEAAYNQAKRMSDRHYQAEIERVRNEAAAERSARAGRARRAASSVTGAPAGAPVRNASDMSMREALEAAWDDAQG